MDFADALNLTPAPAPQAAPQTNAAPSPQSGKKSEFASKLQEVTSNDAAPAANGQIAPKAVESNGSDNIVAQAAAAQPTVPLPAQPVKAATPVLTNAAALNLLTPATSNVAHPANPETMDALLSAANSAGGQIAATGGQAAATPTPDSTTQPVKAKKGAAVEASLDLQNLTATVDETAPKQQQTTAPAMTAQPNAQAAVATAALAMGEISMPALTAGAAASTTAPVTPTTVGGAADIEITATGGAARPVAPTPAGFAGAIAQGPAAARFQTAANTDLHAEADTSVAPQQTTTTQAGRAHVAAGTPDPNLQVSTSQPATQSDARQLVEMTMNALDNAAPSPSAAPAPAPLAGGPASVATASGSTATPSPAALQDAPPVVAQVYTRFIERTDGRSQRFEVSLDPAELGRVDVRIEVGADKKVHAVLAAHDSAALSDLMRGQGSLERALRDAGVDLADKGLSFKLASDSRSGFAGQQQQSGKDDANVWRGFDTVSVPVESDAPIAYSNAWRPSRLDLVA